MRAFAILPAAGRSRRMGQPKLLLPWGDTSLIQQVVGHWRASQVEQVLVVVHPDDKALAQQCESAGAFVVRPTSPPPEMKDSIWCGIQAAEHQFQAGRGDVWLVAPADMPQLQPDAINAVISAYEQQGENPPAEPRIWAARHAGRRGHPVLFPWSLAADVPTLKADEGLKTLLGHYPVEYVDVASDGIFADVDTPEDYDRQRPQ
jgi:molybdenum cofactor cytidylyltransferase